MEGDGGSLRGPGGTGASCHLPALSRELQAEELEGKMSPWSREEVARLE